MKLFNIHVITCNSVSDFHSKFKKRMIVHTTLECLKLCFIGAIAAFLLLEYGAPLAQKSMRIDFPTGMEEFVSLTKSADSSVKEVLRLVNMIRLITENQLSEAKMLRKRVVLEQQRLWAVQR